MKVLKDFKDITPPPGWKVETHHPEAPPNSGNEYKFLNLYEDGKFVASVCCNRGRFYDVTMGDNENEEAIWVVFDAGGVETIEELCAVAVATWKMA